MPDLFYYTHILLRLPCILLLAICCRSSAQHLPFDHITTEQGLSQSNVNCIIQDKHGFIWVGTRDGLNRYDGYKFIIYRYNAADSHSLSDNFITDMVEDAAGNLWIATRNGLNKFDRSAGRFARYIHSPGNPGSIAGNVLNRLAQDRDGNLWIATEMDGLDYFQPQTGIFRHYRHAAQDSTTISDNKVRTVFLDSRSRVWVGTFTGGLNRYDPDKDSFHRLGYSQTAAGGLPGRNVTCLFESRDHRLWVGSQDQGLCLLENGMAAAQCFRHGPGRKNALSSNTIFSLNEDIQGNLWIGTENGGLSILDPSLSRFDNYLHDEVDRHSIDGNSIYSIYRDRSGNMWLGAFSAGINLYKRNSGTFTHFRHSSDPSSLSNNFVLALMEDRDKNIWVGTDGGGVNVQSPGQTDFAVHRTAPHKKDSLSSNYVLTIKVAQDGDIFIGTWGGGLNVFHPPTGRFRSFRHQVTDSTSIASDNVFAVVERADKKVWIGTANAGLDLYDPVTNRFRHYVHHANDPASISSDLILSLLQDRHGALWAGTYDNGLDRLDPVTQTFTHYQAGKGNDSISHNTVPDLFEDSYGFIWISTFHGLDRLDPATGHFTAFTTENGLPGDIIYAVREDDDKKLWISTNKGLSLYDPETGKFRNYNTEDGLQADEFKLHAAIKASDGRMFFGGVNGYNVFYPRFVTRSDDFSPLVITSFQLFNKPTGISGNRDIADTKEITLSYQQTFISLEFAALDYTKEEAHQYAYKLEGIDKDWNYVGSRNSAAYTNLPAGRYEFSIKYRNAAGHWSPTYQKLNIVIIPPYWQTWWLKGLGILLLAGIIFTYIRLRTYSIKTQKKMLQIKVDQQTRSLQQLISEKDILLGEKEWLLKEVHHRVKNNLQIVISLLSTQSTYLDNEEARAAIAESMHRMQAMSLVHQKLYQAENVELVDMASYIRELTGYLNEDFSSGRRLRFQLLIEPIELNVAQALPVGLILNEAITNAIKHAFPDNARGTITITLRRTDDDQLLLGIHDDGIGMAADLEDYQSSSLGMSLMKGMTTQLDGSMTVRNDNGLDIKVEFPLNGA